MTRDRARLDYELMKHLGIILGVAELLLDDAALGDSRQREVQEIHDAATAAGALVSAQTGDSSLVMRTPRSDAPAPLAGPPDRLETLERDHIARILSDVEGNKQAAARRLGIRRRTLYRRLERHGLTGLHPTGVERTRRT